MPVNLSAAAAYSNIVFQYMKTRGGAVPLPERGDLLLYFDNAATGITFNDSARQNDTFA